VSYAALRLAFEIKSGRVTISKDSIPDIAEIMRSCYAEQPIVLSEAEPGTDDGKNETVIIKGKSSFLNLTDLPVVATFKLDGSGKVGMSLNYTLPVEVGTASRWKFSDSFPALPKVVDWRNGTYDNPRRVLLDDLEFDEASFVVVSHQPTATDGVQLKPGINFVGKLRLPDKVQAPLPGRDQTNLIASVIKDTFRYDKEQLTVFGTIRVEENETTALEPLQYPWSAEGSPIPGIQLHADFGLALSLGNSQGSGLKFDRVGLRIYSPTSTKWLSNHETYYPVLAYTGTLGGLSVEGSNTSLNVTALQELGGDELRVLGSFTGASVKNLAGLVDIGGEDNNLLDSIDLLKPAIEKLSGLELLYAALSISVTEGGFDVNSTSVMVGMPNLKWEVIEDVFTIESISALFDVRNPFGTPKHDELSQFRGPKVDVTIMGTVKICGKSFDCTATTRDSFTVNAHLARGHEISLQELLDTYAKGGPPLGNDLKIDYLALSARPKDSHYTFAGRLKSEPKLEIVKGLALSEVVVRVESTTSGTLGEIGAVLNIADVDLNLKAQKQPDGWQFDGSTGPGQEIPIGRLIGDLVAKFHADPMPVPEAIKTLVFQNLALSYNTGTRKRFRFTGEAKLEIEGTPYAISVTVELTDKGGNGRFTGTLMYGGAQFKFELKAGEAGAEFDASWNKEVNGGQLAPRAIGKSPALSQLQSLLSPPKAATLRLKLGADNKVERLALAFTLENEAQAAFLLTQDSSVPMPNWIAALGLKPPRISTDDLGSLGSVLQPHSIALDKLLILAASADAPSGEQLTLDKGYPVTKGLFLQGALEFGGTSFSYPFECRLGGDQKPKARPGPGPGPGASIPPISTEAPSSSAKSDKSAAATEAKNNVAVGRTIGPVTFRQERLESRDERVYLLLDASLGSGGFALDLTGFNLNFPLTLLKDPTPAALAREIKVGLDGLSISYSNPPLTISGGLARTAAESPYVGDVYRGHLLIKAQTFQITVLGSYGTIEAKDRAGKAISTPSLFLYGTFAGVLGGPGVFFVTGLALGAATTRGSPSPGSRKWRTFP
jgi:Family of unknown function (DUF6603)